MSVKVELAGLRDELARVGPAAYLMTVREDARPHAVSVSVAWQGDDLAVEAGSRTAANVAVHPAVTLLWPATETDGFALLVDGTARVDGEQALITPSAAVLHRSRTSAEAAGGASCVKLLEG